MAKIVKHSQLWFKDLCAVNGFPDVVISGESKAANNVTCDRIICCKGTPGKILWLMQSGSGADCWFAWVQSELVEIIPDFVSIEATAL